MPFCGPNRPGAKVSQGLRDSFWLQGMIAGHKAVCDCIKAFSATDFTEDLKKIDVPTLILHGDDDQIVPIGAAAMLSSKIVKGATLKVIAGAPHGRYSTLKDQINTELLAVVAPPRNFYSPRHFLDTVPATAIGEEVCHFWLTGEMAKATVETIESF
jgi:non-heme chloroperoxidase